MATLITRLNNLSSRVSKIKNAEDRKKNAQTIINLNTRFNMCVFSIQSACEFVEFARQAFGFNPSDLLLGQISDSIESAKQIISDENISEDTVTKLEDKNKKWNGNNGSLSKEWKMKHAALSQSTNGLINIVNVVDPQLVSRCKADIEFAGLYSTDIQRFKNLKKAIDDINDLVDKLNLDDEIKTFLNKVGKGTAMMSDVNDKILKWVYAKNLSSKMKITFTNQK